MYGRGNLGLSGLVPPNTMVRGSHHMPAWRAAAAALAAFALAAQLLVSGLLAGSMVRAPGEASLTVICTHDGAIEQTGAPGTPEPQKSHDLCQVCTCTQSAKLVSTLPMPPVLAILRGRSESVPVWSVASGAERHLHSPYASRAPPRTA